MMPWIVLGIAGGVIAAGRFQFEYPELGTLRAKHIPLVVLTSNNAREMSDALKRRCLHLYNALVEREGVSEIQRARRAAWIRGDSE